MTVKIWSSTRKLALLVFLLSLILFSSCITDEIVQYSPINSLEYESKLVLKQMDRKVFELDSTINPSAFSYIDFFEENEDSRIFVMSESAQAFCEFDYKSGKLSKKISFSTEGPNAIHSVSGLDGIKRISSNRILYLNHATANIYMLDSMMRVELRMELDTFFERTYGHPQVGIFASNWSRIVLHDNYVLMPCYPFKGTGTYSNQYSVTKFNFDDLTLLAESTYPVIFDKAFWGYHPLTWFASFAISSEGKTFVSYAIDPIIYEVGVEHGNIIEQTFVGSKYFDGIEPQSYDKGRNKFAEGRSDRNDEYFRQLNFYYGIDYDPYRNLYYRLVRLGKKSREDKVRFSLIVMDDKFEKVFEDKLSEDIDPFSSFITADGLLFYNPSVTSSRELKAVFDVYSFVSSG